MATFIFLFFMQAEPSRRENREKSMFCESADFQWFIIRVVFEDLRLLSFRVAIVIFSRCDCYLFVPPNEPDCEARSLAEHAKTDNHGLR